MKRTVFFISDGTGITAETFGHALLTQFDQLKPKQIRLPFIDSIDKAKVAAQQILEVWKQDGVRPIVFNTLMDSSASQIILDTNALVIELFTSFIDALEQELGIKSTHSVGRSHSATKNSEEYNKRIEAVNFSMAHDDGQSHRFLGDAEVILIGVSRSGKTPTSLYLALTYGLKVANYPLIPEDFERGTLPEVLLNYRHKLFGLTIAPERLANIRHERRPNSTYASLDNCRFEVENAENMMQKEGIRWLSSTSKSIEEIATTVLQEVRLQPPLL